MTVRQNVIAHFFIFLFLCRTTQTVTMTTATITTTERSVPTTAPAISPDLSAAEEIKLKYQYTYSLRVTDMKM